MADTSPHGWVHGEFRKRNTSLAPAGPSPHPSMLRQPKQLKSDFTRTRTPATVNYLRQLLLTLLTLCLITADTGWTREALTDQPLIIDFKERFLPTVARNGMVVGPEQLAAEIGSRILQQGGNVVDAAVATGFALAVTYPSAGNLGGGGFMLIHLAEGNRPPACG